MSASTIDQASAALALSVSIRERLVAALALADAAQAEADRMRAVLRTQATDWLCMHCRQAWPADIEPADGHCPNCHQALVPRKDAV